VAPRVAVGPVRPDGSDTFHFDEMHTIMCPDPRNSGLQCVEHTHGVRLIHPFGHLFGRPPFDPCGFLSCIGGAPTTCARKTSATIPRVMFL
jgi:hypothetical protein